MKSVAAFLVLALIWFAGLFAYAARVQQSTPAPLPERAQGIVVLTGAGSNERIAAAVGLLEDGYGQRVLVSGVNREASREDIRNVSRAVRRLYDCCVDLGFTAADTVGNARETADWAQAMRYASLIVVTTDYHMPRAMLELNAVFHGSGVRLQTYPVPTPSLKARRWWRSPRAARLMVVEYCKYLAILGREAVLGLGPRQTPLDAAPQKAAP
ncbi:YdcF family protein [Phenylobacterium sp. VNQ135]|uniref:YdcF family protein n=1 Tax=Phenylobacterium sp. VNQ135 TaxID=3400922 RepID=UPI003C00F414